MFLYLLFLRIIMMENNFVAEPCIKKLKERLKTNSCLIYLMRGQRESIPLREAERIANRFLKELKKISEVEKALAAGSVRRRIKLVRNINLVVESSNAEKILKEFVKMKFVKTVLVKDNFGASIMTKKGVQVDLRIFEHASFGSGLLYFTGSKEHNIWMKKIAAQQGYLLNEWGLFQRGKKIGGKTEKGIYALLGFKFVKPENRFGENED